MKIIDQLFQLIKEFKVLITIVVLLLLLGGGFNWVHFNADKAIDLFTRIKLPGIP